MTTVSSGVGLVHAHDVAVLGEEVAHEVAPRQVDAHVADSRWALVACSSEVSAPPSSSAWLKVALNSVNLPASVVSISQRPILLVSAAMSPKLTSSVFCAGASST